MFGAAVHGFNRRKQESQPPLWGAAAGGIWALK